MTPRVGVAVFLRRYDDFVMLKRQGSHGAGTWSVPGGKLEYGEHWFDAAIRECAEEVGLYPQYAHFLTITNDMIEGQHWVTIWIVASCRFQGEPQNLEPEKCTEIGWFNFDNLPQPLFGPWENLFNDKLFQQWRKNDTTSRSQSFF